MFQMMMPMIAKHATAAAVGAGVNLFMSGDRFDMMEMARYGAVVGGSSFVSCRLSAMLIPEFDNPYLASIQKIALQSSGTAALNILGQRYVNMDLRIENSAIAGGGGGAGVLVASMIPPPN